MFAMRIKQKRLEAGLNQPEVAAACGVTREAVSQWEKDTNPTRPTFNNIVQLSRLFRVSTDYLFGLSDHETPLKISNEARRCAEMWDSLPAQARGAILAIIDMSKTDGGKNAGRS